MTEVPVRRGPGRPRKVTPPVKERDEDLEGPPAVEVDLMKTPEATAAYAAHGTTAHIRAAEPAAADDEVEGDGAEKDPSDRSGHSVSRHAPGLDAASVTGIGFDDGTEYGVKDGKLTKRAVPAERKPDPASAEDEGK